MKLQAAEAKIVGKGKGGGRATAGLEGSGDEAQGPSRGQERAEDSNGQGHSVREREGGDAPGRGGHVRSNSGGELEPPPATEAREHGEEE